MEWYLKVVRDNYANFEGRARRKEYWMFTLFNVLILIPLYILAIFLMLQMDSSIGIVLYFIYALAILIPGLAVVVRRLHDINKSGWMILVSFIPFIGGIWLLVLMVTEGDAGSNQYGPDPKGSAEEIEEIGKVIE
ncbi:MAG: DUF805 domain-containing protein [Flavobacteriaceae bacterium]|nr:DUF805 domain-containing protein [Bacteroidia bacterium]NNK81720.1 DUF805 domain-containing protein [Flavobacteriaceae bacterium]